MIYIPNKAYEELCTKSDLKKLRTRLRGFYKRIGFVKWKTKDGFQFMIKKLKDRD